MTTADTTPISKLAKNYVSGMDLLLATDWLGQNKTKYLLDKKRANRNIMSGMNELKQNDGSV